MHILFHRSTPWQSEINCSTKTYAKLFRKAGHQVSYFEDMIHLGHIFTRKGYYKVWKKSPRFEDNIWIFNTITSIPYLFKPVFHANIFAMISYLITFPSIKSILFKSGRKDPDVIWTTKPGSTALKKIFPKSLIIFHVVDYYPAFHDEKIKRLERNDYQKADHVFVIGHSLEKYLVEELKIDNDKVTVLGQGVSIDKYTKEYNTPNDIVNLPKPRAIWVGELKKCDLILFNATAKCLSEMGGSLILIGNEEKNQKEICSENCNVFYLGPKNTNIVPAYLKNADIGIMLYNTKKSKVYIGQNPLKLYEYAAAGLPIISTHHDEFESLNPPVIEVKSVKDIPWAIAEAIDNKKYYKKLSLKFAKQHTWEMSLENAQILINKLRAKVRMNE